MESRCISEGKEYRVTGKELIDLGKKVSDLVAEFNAIKQQLDDALDDVANRYSDGGDPIVKFVARIGVILARMESQGVGVNRLRMVEFDLATNEIKKEGGAV